MIFDVDKITLQGRAYYQKKLFNDLSSLIIFPVFIYFYFADMPLIMKT
jgi:hypothetical protein